MNYGSVENGNQSSSDGADTFLNSASHGGDDAPLSGQAAESEWLVGKRRNIREAIFDAFRGCIDEPKWLQVTVAAYHLFTVVLIVAMFMSEAVDEPWYYYLLEKVVAVVFTFEYVVAIFVCVTHPDSHTWWSATKRRLQVMTWPFMIGDAVSLAALFIDLAGVTSRFKGLVALRWLRIFRLTALLRLDRVLHVLFPVISVLELKVWDLAATLAIAFLMLMIAASMMFYIESPVNPNYANMGSSLYWGTTALTTVGYGDIYPITPAGRTVACFVAFIGISLFGLPAGIIASGFDEVREMKKEKARLAELADLEAGAGSPAAASPAAGDDDLRRLREEVAALREQLAAGPEKATTELQSLRSEVAALREGQEKILKLVSHLAGE